MRCSRCHNMTDSDGFCASCGVRSSRPTLFGASRCAPGIFCPHCGSQNPPGWGYCGACGSVNAARKRQEWLAGVLALLLALLALMFLARALDSTPQPSLAPASYGQPQPIPVVTQMVVVSTSSDGVSRSTEVVQTGDGAAMVSSVTTSTTEVSPSSVAPDPSTPAGPNATTGSMTYNTISAVN